MQMLPFGTGTMCQAVSVWQDDVFLTNLVLPAVWAVYEIPSAASPRSVAELRFVCAGTQRPCDSGMGNDTRPLAAAIAAVRRVSPR